MSTPSHTSSTMDLSTTPPSGSQAAIKENFRKYVSRRIVAKSIGASKHMKIKFKQGLRAIHVKEFWEQLNTGCGGLCNYTFCASNPAQSIAKLTPSEKAALAIKLSVKVRTALYDQLASPVSSIKHNEPFLSLEKLQRIIHECQEANAYVVLVRLVGEAFRSANALSLSFLASPLVASPTGEDFGLCYKDIREAYDLLLGLQQESVTNALVSALDSLASQLARSSSLLHPHQLRQLIILLEFPLLSDPTHHKRILSPLLIAYRHLPASSRQLLDHYFSTWSDDRLREWNTTLQNLIAVSALEHEVEDEEDEELQWEPHADAVVVAATVGIGIVARQNETRHILGFQDLYSHFINEKLDISEDFKRYYFEDRHHEFHFISCPYVLNPETKSNLLQIENSVAQQVMARNQMLDGLIAGHMFVQPYLVLRIHRERLIATSLDALRVPSEDLKKQLKIQFVGEEGIDEGGVKKEWFQLLVKELFDVKYGMFTTDHVNRLQWFNPASMDFGEFELLGKVLGLAVYNAVILDLHFPSVVYKKLTGLPGTFEDLAQVKPELARGLSQLLAYNEESGEKVEDVFCLNFRVSYEVYGSVEAHDLIENGADIPVTVENRQRYVELYTDFILNGSIAKQFERFRKGFSTVCDSKIFHLFRYEELELLICGSPVLDFQELEENTTYEGYTPDDVTIKNFWTVLHDLTLDQKKRFLFFATGTDRAPIGGLSRIGLVISKHGEENRLPSSHTCFAVVMLPPTPDLEKMRKSIHVVLENAEGFGMI